MRLGTLATPFASHACHCLSTALKIAPNGWMQFLTPSPAHWRRFGIIRGEAMITYLSVAALGLVVASRVSVFGFLALVMMAAWGLAVACYFGVPASTAALSWVSFQLGFIAWLATQGALIALDVALGQPANALSVADGASGS
jgi:hypothetical protein